MATEQQVSSTEETSGQEQQVTQPPTVETTGSEQQQEASTPEKPAELPADHPLVTAHERQKALVASQKTEIAELRASAAKATKLEEELAARPSPEALATLQTRYDRLEAFLQEAGGPIGRALDSRTFTRDLFETDKDINSIVKDWQKANPSATSSALGAAAADPGKGNLDANTLIRIAAGKQ